MLLLLLQVLERLFLRHPELFNLEPPAVVSTVCACRLITIICQDRLGTHTFQKNGKISLTNCGGFFSVLHNDMQGAPAPFKTFGSIGGGHWVAAARLPHMPPGNLDWCEQKKTHWFIYLSRRRFLYEKTDRLPRRAPDCQTCGDLNTSPLRFVFFFSGRGTAASRCGHHRHVAAWWAGHGCRYLAPS